MADTVRTEAELLVLFKDNNKREITAQRLRDFVVSCDVDNQREHLLDTDNPHETTAAQVGALISVDGVSNPGGNINLIEGSNITITSDNTAKTITISSSGGGGGGDPDGPYGSIQFNDEGSFGGSANFVIDDSNNVSLDGSFTVDSLQFNSSTISSIDEDGQIVIAPTGSGSLIISTTGNSRGDRAIDFQRVRNNNNQVAFGDDSGLFAGQNNRATGNGSVIIGGQQNIASGENSSILGGNTNVAAIFNATVVGGIYNTAGDTEASSGYHSFVTGNANTAKGNNSFVCGINNITQPQASASHVSGSQNEAFASYVHVEGNINKAFNENCHVEGRNNQAIGKTSHAEGFYNNSNGEFSHVEGYSCVTGEPGISCTISGIEGGSHISVSGNQTAIFSNGYAVFLYSLTGGDSTTLFVQTATISSEPTYDVEISTTEFDIDQDLEGRTSGMIVSNKGLCAHAEGSYTTAFGRASHAEGSGTVAIGEKSHSEGSNSVARGESSHAEGADARAEGYASHAEGYGCWAVGHMSHAEGYYGRAIGFSSHAEAIGKAYGSYSHSEGNSRVGDTASLFTISGTTVTITGDVTNIFQNGDDVAFYDLNGGMLNNLFMETYSISDVLYDSENGGTTFTISSELSDRAGGICAVTSRSRNAHAEGSSIANAINAHSENIAEAHGENSHAEGNSRAYGEFSHSQGHGSYASLFGQFSHASGMFSSFGDAQTSTIVMQGETSSSEQTTLSANSEIYAIPIPQNKVMAFSVMVVANSFATEDLDQSAAWEFKGCIRNLGVDSDTTEIVGSVLKTVIAIDADDPWDVEVSSQGLMPGEETTDVFGIAINVTGSDSYNVRWVATINTTELGFFQSIGI